MVERNGREKKIKLPRKEGERFSREVNEFIQQKREVLKREQVKYALQEPEMAERQAFERSEGRVTEITSENEGKEGSAKIYE